MKLIKPKAELLIQPEGLEGIYKQIEKCGRTCYRSEDKITEDSAKPFVDRMIKSNHLAMLEHGTVYLKDEYIGGNGDGKLSSLYKYNENKYSKVYDFLFPAFSRVSVTVTTNFRVLVENGWLNDLQYVCEPTEFHEKRYTFRFTTDRGVSHELVRHRVFSFAQESTRYCNYSKDKFGKELTFIIPSWAKNRDEISYTHHFDVEEREKLQEDFGASYGGFIHQLSLIEDEYFYQLEHGRTPQEARQVLPNALKTEVCMTGFASDWRHFFDLRYFGTTGKPHPDMLQLATLMKVEAEEHGIWNEISNSNK